jgi:hypothetical protein
MSSFCLAQPTTDKYRNRTMHCVDGPTTMGVSAFNGVHLLFVLSRDCTRCYGCEFDHAHVITVANQVCTHTLSLTLSLSHSFFDHNIARLTQFRYQQCVAGCYGSCCTFSGDSAKSRLRFSWHPCSPILKLLPVCAPHDGLASQLID